MTKRIRRRLDAKPSEGLEKYGNTTFADPTNKKYPIDTPGRIKAAWAYIHQPSNAAKYTAADRRTIQSRIRKAAKTRREVSSARSQPSQTLRAPQQRTELGTCGTAHPATVTAFSKLDVDLLAYGALIVVVEDVAVFLADGVPGRNLCHQEVCLTGPR